MLNKVKTVTGIIVLCMTLSIFFGHAFNVRAQVPVSASVLDLTIHSPTLISPIVDAILNTSRPTFSWSRPSPATDSPLHHYDLYIDDTVFASSISDSLTSQEYYFYNATASAGVFYITVKTDLAQGYHTWKVTAYNDAENSSTTSTRTFYIDSISPFISVTMVDKQTLTWNSSVPSSLPTNSASYLNVTTPNPILIGGVETSSNIQIILVCPQNIPTCTNQTYSSNVSTGSWQTQFFGLSKNQTYTVNISATDAASNSTTFPSFYLTYGVSIITPLPTSTLTLTPTSLPTLPPASPSATPTASPSAFPSLPLPTGTVTPPPNLLNIITPVPFIPPPPIAPSPPPQRTVTPPRVSVNLFYNFLIILMIFGLPLHLAMAIIGSSVPLKFIPKFLLVLALPFFQGKKYQSVSFAFIDFFISDKLDKPWQSVVTNIKGFYNLKSPIPSNLFISLTVFGRTWQDNLFKGSIIPITCLFPLPVKPLDDRMSLQKTIYDIRIIPLLLAILTGTGAFVIQPSNFILIYIYLSAQYLFSEYLYPKL